MSGAGVTKMSHFGYHLENGMDTPECVEELTVPISADISRLWSFLAKYLPVSLVCSESLYNASEMWDICECVVCGVSGACRWWAKVHFLNRGCMFFEQLIRF